MTTEAYNSNWATLVSDDHGPLFQGAFGEAARPDLAGTRISAISVRHRQALDDGPGHRRWIGSVQHEAIRGVDRRLGDHPRPRATVRPGRRVHHERVAQENVPGLPGGVRGRHAQRRRPPEVRVRVGARLAVGRQEPRDGQVRAAQQPGRRVVPANIGEQEQRQQPAGPGPDVHPARTGSVRGRVAALDVIPGVGSLVFGREPHHDRLSEIRQRHGARPPARPDQLVVGGGQRRRQVRRCERLARQVVHALHERGPATGVIPPDAAPLHRRPDQLPASRHRTGVHRPANGHIPVPNKSIQVHPAMMTPAMRPVTRLTRRFGKQPRCRRGRRAVRRSAGQQHELPAHVALLAHPVRLGNLGEGEGLRDREREAPGFDQLADLAERVDRAAGVPAAEPHPVLPGAAEVGERDDVPGAAGELDELGQHPAPGDVERDVNAVGRERANPLDEALAVGDRLGPQRAQVVVVGRTGGADHARAARHGQLNRGAADAAGGAVDEQRAADPHAELVKRPRGRLDSGRQRGSGGEVKRRRDRRVVGQHRQLGLGRSLGGQAEHPIADGHVRHALAELVDDARRLVAQGLRELLVHQALALLPVARVDACRAHRDPDLAGTRMRIGRFDGNDGK